MDVLSVTLEEVLGAAKARAASLVPETSGYLALAIADASARLPFRLDDDMVALTTEGSVQVARGTVVVPAQESAQRIRDMLARLLALSIGSAPALAAASRARRESPVGVDGFIAELENALVPVNRAAARRALARLARETARARESGKLRRRKTSKRPPADREALAAAAEVPPAPRAPAPLAPAPTVAAPPSPAAVVPTTSAEIDLGIDVELSPAPPALAASTQAQPTPLSAEPAAPAAHQAVEPAVLAATGGVVAAPAIAAPAEKAASTAARSDAPERPAPLFAQEEAEEPPTICDAPVELTPEPTPPPKRRKRSGAPAEIALTSRSDVDDLLSKFVVSTLSTPDGMERTRKSLKRLAGLDATPPPPTVEELRKLTARPPQVEERATSKAPLRVELTPIARPHERPRTFVALALAVGFVLAGLLGHYLPSWVGELRAESPEALP